MTKLFFIFGILLIAFQGYAQVIYGVNNYTQYHIGALPIVLSVPHGGLIAPADIPTRTCNSPTTVWDNYTINLGRQIDTALFNLTGCRPHLIICNMRRTKVDCNRNIADGACGNSQAEKAWTEFQDFIDTAQTIAKNQYMDKAFYIDLHAHGHDIKRLELGYGLSASRLDGTDANLNSATSIATSSLRNLVTTNISGSTHAQLIRGTNALGTLLGNAGFASVPSQQTPTPATDPYFSGGYNTFNHTCILPGNTVNGLQIESPSTVWGSYSTRKKFADSLAVVIRKFILVHQNININNCTVAALPIELLTFSGSATDSKNVLLWTTASETNNQYFTLLKSNNGDNFENIAIINGAGNSSKPLNYTFVDKKPLFGTNYYQLQQTDFDGKTTFSKIISIENTADETNSFVISPNPTTGFIHLHAFEDKKNFQVKILNALGTVVFVTENQTNIDISHFSKGIYFVNVTDEQQHLYFSKIILE